jgi:hypothetical protein
VEVHAGVVAHRGVRTRTRLHPDDALGIEHASERRPHVLGVLPGEDVVGHDQRAMARRNQARNERFDQRRLAGADRSPDADAGDARRPHRVERLAIMGVVVNMRMGHRERLLRHVANRRSSACS